MFYTISTLAQAAGIGVETIRFYQRKDLLPTPPKPLGSIRRYSEETLARLRFIKSAQRLGFSLVEVGQLLQLDDGMSCEEACQIAELRLLDTQRRIQELQQVEQALANTINACNAPTGNIKCPLIVALQTQEQRRELPRKPLVITE